jgi:hypothetical protein
VASTDLPPAPSTNDAASPSKYTGRPAASEADSGAAVSGSAAKTRVSGFSSRTARNAAEQPPPPSGATIASTSGRSSRISRPAVALPAMKRSSSNGCTKCPACDPSRAIPRSASTRRSGADDRRAEPLDGADLRVGRGVHDHDRTARTDFARRQRHALRRVAGADGPHAVLQLVARQLADVL